MTWIAPQLALPAGRGPAALVFYREGLGAEVEHQVGGTEAEPPVVAQLAVGDARFWVTDEGEANALASPQRLGAATARLLLVVDDPVALQARAVAAGATERSPVGEEHGWLVGRIVDPFGHQWELGRPLRDWPGA